MEISTEIKIPARDQGDGVTVRNFKSSDRDAVREIACDTADRGNPVDNFLNDREIAADLLTRYYTDFEPESAWVAEMGGAIPGYIIGSVRPKFYDAITILRIYPSAFIRALFRNPQTRADIWSLASPALNAVFSEKGITAKILRNFPAHLHINLRPESRGNHIGRKLVEKFEDHVIKSGLTGIHARVREDNAGGRHFFESLGYTPAMTSKPITLKYRDGSLARYSLVTYVKKI
ncbi:MAG: GNAT family N-acetyltransferase [bacterium]|nr:GNAT family N-acetyltransferase [bacterium]